MFRAMPLAEFEIFEPSDFRLRPLIGDFPNVQYTKTPIASASSVGKHLSFGWGGQNLDASGFDVFERFNLPVVTARGAVNILTTHDVRGVSSGLVDIKGFFRKQYTRYSMSRADKVITVSETMKAEIERNFANADVSVVYNGVDASLYKSISSEELSAFRRKYCLPDGYILAVGHLEARKNILHLINAVSLLRGRGLDVPLVVIGNDSGQGRLVSELIEKKSLGGSVRVLSGLTDLDVRCAYGLSSLLVFPSRYEGFGIPILEAMAASCPMVLSDIPVFREITQNQGLYFDCNDVEAIAHSIETGLHSTVRRKELVSYGDARVSDFGFDRLAAQLAVLYDQALQN
ncbi:MAG: glycosyltransferase family 1 protein [Pseudomonadales bacterium]